MLVDIQTLKMAAANSVPSSARHFSEYCGSLKGAEKTRYKEKVELCGFDPYSLKNSEYNDDSTHLPCIEYPDIVNYLVLQTSWATKQEMKAYKSMDAYNFFISGWVNNLFTKQVGEDKTVVFARVNHSQRARETPLKTWYLAEKDGNVICAHCNCMAGLSEACSHVGALLFATEASVRINASLTCTQQKSKWVMPGYVKQVPYIPVCEMDFTSSKTKHKLLLENQITPSASLLTPDDIPARSNIPSTSSEEQLQFFKNIAACSTRPVILSLVPKLNETYIPKENNTLPKQLTTLFNQDNINLPFDELLLKCKDLTFDLSESDCSNVESKTRKQSSSPVWFQQREGRITASRLRAVCHTNPDKPSKSLVKSICYPGAHKFSSAATNWGITHETDAREKYTEIMSESHEGFIVSDSGLHINPKWPFMGASPDGISKCHCCGKGLCEIKCPYSHRDSTVAEALGSKNFCLQQNDTGVNLTQNHAYYYQVQMQLFITGTDYCDFIIWTPKDIYIERIVPDNDFWDNAVTKATLFFNRCILPELVGKWFTRPSSSQLPSTMSEESEGDNDGVWCFCEQYIPDSQLIGCDNDNCKVQWYHMACLGITAEPVGSWICPTCQNS